MTHFYKVFTLHLQHFFLLNSSLKKKSCESASPLFCFKFMAQMGGQMRISLHFQLSGQHNFKV